MRLKPDEFYDNLTWQEISNEFDRLGMSTKTTEIGKAASQLKSLQRQRMFACWHDTSCVSNASHFLILICCLYDEALFYTNQEYLEKTGKLYYFTLVTSLRKLSNH